jgi:hypothetical protein
MVHSQYAIPIEDRKSFHDCAFFRYYLLLNAGPFPCWDIHELADDSFVLVCYLASRALGWGFLQIDGTRNRICDALRKPARA